MAYLNFSSYTNGTSALKMQRWVAQPDEATIIKFPGSKCRTAREEPPHQEPGPQRETNGFKNLERVFESSEMYCSLRYESMLGCPYHLFTRKGIAVLSVGASVIAAIALILGA